MLPDAPQEGGGGVSLKLRFIKSSIKFPIFQSNKAMKIVLSGNGNTVYR